MASSDNTLLSDDEPLCELSDPEAFRAAAHQVIDFICDYRAALARGGPATAAASASDASSTDLLPLRVMPSVEPGDVFRSLPSEAPEQGEKFADIFRDFEQLILPGVTHWQHPQFFAFYPSNTSEPGMLGELLSSAVSNIGFQWMASPSCTELETVVMDWIARLLDLPEPFFSTNGKGGGSIQGTASEAVLVCLVAARNRVVKRALREAGLEPGKEGSSKVELAAQGSMVGYVSDQAHSSCKKAFMVAGVPLEHLRTIPTGADNTLDPKDLAAAIQKDREAGLIPAFCVATVGTTSTGASDPVEPIGEICQKEGVWLHVDAAWAGSACILPEYRHYLNGVQLAESFNFNPHKWMLVPFDCSALYVTDRELLIDALALTPAYLRNKASESGKVIDYRDWQIPLGRRFRALKVWFVLRSYGKVGLQRALRRHIALADLLAGWIAADPNFELAHDRAFALVTFRMVGSEDENKELYEATNASGDMMLTHTLDHGKYTIRWSIGALLTQKHHVEAAWKLFTERAAGIRAKRQ